MSDTHGSSIRPWIERYQRAWSTNQPEDVRALFTDGAEYRTEPYLPPTVGVEAIVAQWLDRRDEPDAWEFEWDSLGSDGQRFFVQGVTRYAKGTTYSNLWVIDLADDGRARAFTEWWMDQSEKS